MAYLYGDSTPFPFEDNFIETLRDVTDACVALLGVDEKLDGLYDRQDEARQAAEGELGRIEDLATSMVKVLEPHIGGEMTGAAQVAVRVANAARGVLEHARGEARNHRDAAMRDIESEIMGTREGIARAVESFFRRRELPETAWRLKWVAGLGVGAPNAQVEGQTSFKLSAVMDLDLTGSPLFAHPIRVSELTRGVRVRLPETGGWLRKRSRMVRHTLDRWYITEIESGGQRKAIVVRQSNKHPSAGYEIVVAAEGQLAPTIKPLGIGVMPAGDAAAQDGLEAISLKRLWDQLDARMRGLEKKRSRLITARFDGQPLAQVSRPAVLAERMIGVVAPLVREMRHRCAAASELVLKRDLGGGRREELYISRTELTGKFATLGPARRGLFAGFGLDDDTTDEAVTKDYDVFSAVDSQAETYDRRASA